MKVFWTKSSLAALYEIYKYYKENVSAENARKIRKIILSATDQLEKYPRSGQIEELLEGVEGSHRYIVRNNYKLIYKIENNKVYITDIFDTRQDPDKIKERNQ